MAHHKRRRPKRQRAGCMLCKPHKRNGSNLADRNTTSLRRRLQDSVPKLIEQLELDQQHDFEDRMIATVQNQAYEEREE